MDLTILTDAELNALRIDVITEQERRAKLDAIPAQVATLAEQFIEAGGAQIELDDAVAPPAVSPTPSTASSSTTTTTTTSPTPA